MFLHKEVWEDVVSWNDKCGNENHPNGPWHHATPLPSSKQWVERVKQWWRKKRYGCGCKVMRIK